MDADRIKTLLDEAAERYNEGLYEEAITLWNETLALEPSNQKAREGIRMASLLTADWANTANFDDAGAGDVQADEGEARARVEAGVSRVKELAAAGQFAEALEGCELLAELAPDLAEIRKLTEEVRASARAAPRVPGGDIEEHLEEARAALADGRNREAAIAAKRALSIDPSNMEACGILSISADDDEMPGTPLAIGTDGAAESGSHDSFDTGEIPAQEPADSGPIAPGQHAKVRNLIAEGQAALAGGHPEMAIEIWSRVFAIDRGSTEAGTLIDGAKSAIEEQARRVDEIYYRAVDAAEAGRDEEALELFGQVLAIAPRHPDARTARDEAKARLSGFPGALPLDQKAAQEVATERKRGFSSPEEEPEPLTLARPPQESSYPPRVVATTIKQTEVKPAILAPRSTGGGKRPVLAVAGAILVLTVGVGAWLWLGSGTGSMPEAQATVSVPTRPAERPAAMPIYVVPGATPKPEPPAPVAPPSPEELKRQAAALTQEGRRFYQEKRWVEAVLAFKKALATDPIDFDAQDQLDKAMAELEKAATLEREMTTATKFFGEGDFAGALHKFYRLQQDHIGMKILDTYIENSWFNWGVSLLQAGAVDEAVEKFDEVLLIDSRDQHAARAREIGKRYHGRQRDAAFDAFASALPLREIDAR